MDIIKRPLPAFCYSSRPITKVMGIVDHYFSAINVDPINAFNPDTCYDLFVDLNSPGDERGLVMPTSGEGRLYASAQFMIARNGDVYQLVPETRIAYHAGKSSWKGYDNLNEWTIGIEWIGTHDSGFTDEQYASGGLLHALLMTRYGFGLDWVMGHEDVAPGRKRDPGPLFDWPRLREPLRSIVV